MTTQPHILIFNPDQWRHDIMGHMGNPAAVTPNLDHFVENDAVSFSHAFCQSTVCVPSRCSFMTGWYPHTRGHRTMAYMLQPDEPMLLRTLKQQGYYVWWGGKNDVIPAQNTFDDYCDVKYRAPRTPQRPLNPDLHQLMETRRGTPDDDNYYSFYYGQIEHTGDGDFVYDNDQAMIEGAIDLIRNPPTDQPLCIFLPLGYPHPPYGVEEPWFSRIDRNKMPPRIPAPANWSQKPSLLKQIYDNQGLQGWTEDHWTELRATYYGMCSRVDAQFGLVINAFKESNMYDYTAIFFFSDHGDFTGDYGLVEKTQNTFEDFLTRIPLIVKPPAHMPTQPRITNALVELVDFSATVEAILGIVPGHTHFGRSLLPVISGETDHHRDTVFCQGGRIKGEDHAKELIGELTPELLYYPRIIVKQMDDVAHTKAVMVRTHAYKYVYRLYEQDELYELSTDPFEQHNRINDPSLANIKNDLIQRLIQFQTETADIVPHQPDQR